ncbi:MAG TPA: BON domain-containing protein [Gammaproteobacteria bacterium]|jgi:osmotically-inducible protein OsmY|nr:BON domain-containing protein [Gammaproteobacteria bacterium]
MNNTITKITVASLISMSCAMLPGCIFVAGAAAGAATIAIVYDHRSIESNLKDNQITNKIAERIKAVPGLHQDSHIEVTVFNRVVLLTGETLSQEKRQQAEAIARSVPDVSQVYNQITIEGPTSSLTRTSDSWITAKAKSQMLANKDLKSSSIKVITENGTVYLMGIVTQDQAEIAVDIAREIDGVQKVVRVFQYKK